MVFCRPLGHSFHRWPIATSSQAAALCLERKSTVRSGWALKSGCLPLQRGPGFDSGHANHITTVFLWHALRHDHCIIMLQVRGERERGRDGGREREVKYDVTARYYSILRKMVARRDLVSSFIRTWFSWMIDILIDDKNI